MSLKKQESITPAPVRTSDSVEDGKLEAADDAFEVFKRGEGEVDFRTVGWIHASVIFLKGPSLLQPPLLAMILTP